MDYIKIQIDAEMKKSAQILFEDMGLNLSQGIKLFLKQCLNRGALPFEVKGNYPNEKTIAAIEELERGEGHSFNGVEEMFKSWEED